MLWHWNYRKVWTCLQESCNSKIVRLRWLPLTYKTQSTNAKRSTLGSTSTNTVNAEQHFMIHIVHNGGRKNDTIKNVNGISSHQEEEKGWRFTSCILHYKIRHSFCSYSAVRVRAPFWTFYADVGRHIQTFHYVIVGLWRNQYPQSRAQWRMRFGFRTTITVGLRGRRVPVWSTVNNRGNVDTSACQV